MFFFQPFVGLEKEYSLRSNLENIVLPAQQLLNIDCSRYAGAGSVKVVPCPVLLSIVQFLPELAPIICRDRQLDIDRNSSDAPPGSPSPDSSLLLVQQEDLFP